MNYRSALVLLVACCCFVAMVSMSAALQTSISGTPDDVLDADSIPLPLSSDKTADLKSAAQSEGASEESSDTGSQSDGSGGRSSTAESSGGGDSSPADSTDGSGDSGSQSSDATTDGSGTNGGTEPRDLVDRLLELLRTWFERLLGAAGVLLLLAIAGLLIHKRAILWREIQRYFGGDDTDRDAGDTGFADRTRPPENPIERKWLEMVSAGDGGETNLTPRERADNAVERGLYQQPVRELTALYEDVRYGDQAVTTGRVQRAGTYLQQARGQTDD